MRVLVFEHQYGHGSSNRSREEFEFADDATDKEIEEVYIEWMISLVADSCTRYEKGEGN